MKVLSLFSGIGAFDLGLSRAGFETIAFCEIELFARRVLAKHWPGVPCYHDVRSLSAARLHADGIFPDVIAGGFPCQPHSVAGKRGAGADERDLWPEFARLIREVRPRWVLAENVPGLRSSESGRFFGGILRDLAGAGYDAEWRSISAADVGAPHIRDRIWIVAYAEGRARQLLPSERKDLRDQPAIDGAARPDGDVADADSGGRREQGDVGEAAGDTGAGQPRDCGALPVTGRTRLAIGPGTLREWSHAATTGDGIWAVERPICRVVDGASRQLDRRKRLIGLGNSLVPQIPEIIGRAIMAYEASASERAA